MEQIKETKVSLNSGWTFLALLIGAIALSIFNFINLLPVFGLILIPVAILIIKGFIVVQPNESRVLVLFGKYKGTVLESGFYWGNPFYSKSKFVQEGDITKFLNPYKISLKARTHHIAQIKVNDKLGNPIEIGAIVVWKVTDTVKALFEVDNYESYLATQSESALRHMTSQFAYDNDSDHAKTLRADMDDVSGVLLSELNSKVSNAGIEVIESKITHLAYSPEIAHAMLRRQQAEAVIAARQKIVHGAVSMVEMAINDLKAKNILDLSEDKKSSIVANLMVVLCSENQVSPIINTGTSNSSGE